MADDPSVVSVERVIPALTERIFPLVADPARHRDIDGSGTVREAKGVPSEPLRLGSTFGMHTQAGNPYSMVNSEERGKQVGRGAAKHTRASMEQTLERTDALVTG